ncbi:hypothetical protein DFP72DRAFT_1124436 [Ephemerocybe angulata]|uniref:Uncharacterized protein n=1 Tax=Ephemerocybe angulata TaxID=980116 RepID=A0A8H6HYN4_9AGAR|nr:hypothetical protein DFP72DRAFT_1124436 [Tulosesus angulatus]
MSRTANKYRAEAEPLLYRSVSIHTNRPKSLDCLKTLHENKHKALFVTSLALNVLEDNNALEPHRIGGALANTKNLTFLSIRLAPQRGSELTGKCLFDILGSPEGRPECIKHLRGLFINTPLLFTLNPFREQCPNLSVVGVWNVDARAVTDFLSEGCSAGAPKPLLLGLAILPKNFTRENELSVGLFDPTLEAADLAAGRTPLTDFTPLGEEMRQDLMTDKRDSTGLPPGQSIGLTLMADRLNAANLSRLVAVAEGMSGMFEYEHTDSVSICYSSFGDIAWPELRTLLNAFYPPSAPHQDPLGPAMLEIYPDPYREDEEEELTVMGNIIAFNGLLNDPALARLTRTAALIEFSPAQFKQIGGVWHIYSRQVGADDDG